MSNAIRHSPEDIRLWQHEGFAIMPAFFSREEIEPIFADYEQVYGEPHRNATDGESTRKTLKTPLGKFNNDQFRNMDTFPYEGSPELMMLSLHPALIAFARDALGVQKVQLYQSHTWAKFTGLTDYEQPFHCDFGNHTLTVPSDNVAERAVDIVVYFTDVTKEHGALHYVTKSDSNQILRPGAIAAPEENQQLALRAKEKAMTCKAGDIVAHGIDTFHRGTNLTIKNGYRYSMTIGYKATGNHNVSYHVWQAATGRNWTPIFEMATPEQLECIGIPLPGDPYWTNRTLKLTQSRWPSWNMKQYFEQAIANQ
tara:strand:+ start:876 stop:1808 length:933 start_codon:yes stop_codon:yes gene_type:complete